jgi:hypothetical protein
MVFYKKNDYHVCCKESPAAYNISPMAAKFLNITLAIFSHLEVFASTSAIFSKSSSYTLNV